MQHVVGLAGAHSQPGRVKRNGCSSVRSAFRRLGVLPERVTHGFCTRQELLNLPNRNQTTHLSVRTQDLVFDNGVQ